MKVAPQQPHHMRRRRGLLQGKHSQQSLSALRSSNGAGCSASGCAAAGGASARPHPVQKAADSLSSFPHSGQDRVAGGVLADATGHPAAPPSSVRAEVCSTISDLSGNTATIVCSGSSARIHIYRLIRSAPIAGARCQHRVLPCSPGPLLSLCLVVCSFLASCQSVFTVSLSLGQSVVWKKELNQFPSCLARVKCVFRVILLDADWPAVEMLAAVAGPVRGWSGQRPVRVLVGKMCRKHHQKQSP